MGRYIIKRLIQLIPILIGITFLSFAMMRLAGGDAVTYMYENAGAAVSQEIIDKTKTKTKELKDSDESVKNWLQQMASAEGENTEETQSQKNEAVKMYANEEDINVRAEANTDSEVLTMLAQGDEVTVLGDAGNGWSKIEIDGVTGYVMTEFLSAQ